MAQYRAHADISTQQFPYNFFELSSTTFVGSRGLEQDQSGSIPGTPQAYFMENVLPLSRGYSAVGFTQKVPPNNDISGIINSFPVYGEGGRVALFQYSENSAWVFDPSGGIWVELSLPVAGIETITFGTVREVTYIHLGIGLYYYNFSNQQLELADIPTLPGVGSTLGVASAGSQLILWDQTNLYISSVIDPLDFTPSIDTGANTGKIQQLRGTIVACITLGRDFIVYSDINAVAARWTDNLAFPYRYNEIRGSSGINNIRHVAFNSNTGIHIVWTQSGFQQVGIEQAEYIWPELSDGIIRGLLIRKNSIFDLPELVRSDNLDVTVNFVSNRYVAVSTIRTGTDPEENFFDCYVFDSSLGRWGKLALPHSGFVEYIVPEVFDPYTYDDLAADYTTYGEMEATGLSYRGLIPGNTRPAIEVGNNLGVVLPDGSVQAISYWETSDFRGSDGSEFGAVTPSIIFGKYKLVRQEGMMTQWTKLARLYNAKLTWWGHLYNGDFASRKVLEFENPEQPGQWFGMEAADSVSLEIQGQFKLTSLELCFATAGTVNQKRLDITEDVVFTTEVFPEPVDPNACCEWTSERMIQNIQFEKSTPDTFLTIEFDMQNCAEIAYVQTMVLGSSNSMSDFDFGSNNELDILSADAIHPDHRPEVQQNIEVKQAWESSLGARKTIAYLVVDPSGAVRFLSNFGATDSLNAYIASKDDGGINGSVDNPQGMATQTKFWRLGSV